MFGSFFDQQYPASSGEIFGKPGCPHKQAHIHSYDTYRCSSSAPAFRKRRRTYVRLRGHCEAGFEGRDIRPGVVEAVEAERAFYF